MPPGLKKIADSPPPDDKGTDPSSPRTIIGDDVETEVVGKVVSIDGQVLTLGVAENQTRKFRVSKDARIQLDDQSARLRDLRPGDAVRVKTGGDPDAARAIRAVSPPPSSDREPDEQLRQRRQAELRNKDDAQDQQRMQEQRQLGVTSQSGGRVWMLMMDPAGSTAESGMRPGDVILIVDSKMVQSENVLSRFNLPSGLFPLQTNGNGEVFIGPNGAGVGIAGPGGGLLPTGINISNGGVGLNGVNTNPSAFAPVGSQPPRGDKNFGPPIGGGPNPADRNFGPPIGTAAPRRRRCPQTPHLELHRLLVVQVQRRELAERLPRQEVRRNERRQNQSRNTVDCRKTRSAGAHHRGTTNSSMRPLSLSR